MKTTVGEKSTEHNYPQFLARLYNHLRKHHHLFPSRSYSFLLVAGWWLSYSPQCNKVKMSWHCQTVVFLWLGKPTYIWRPEPHFSGHRGRVLYNPEKPRLFYENRYEWDPCPFRPGCLV